MILNDTREVARTKPNKSPICDSLLCLLCSAEYGHDKTNDDPGPQDSLAAVFLYPALAFASWCGLWKPSPACSWLQNKLQPAPSSKHDWPYERTSRYLKYFCHFFHLMPMSTGKPDAYKRHFLGLLPTEWQGGILYQPRHSSQNAWWWEVLRRFKAVVPTISQRATQPTWQLCIEDHGRRWPIVSLQVLAFFAQANAPSLMNPMMFHVSYIIPEHRKQPTLNASQGRQQWRQPSQVGTSMASVQLPIAQKFGAFGGTAMTRNYTKSIFSTHAQSHKPAAGQHLWNPCVKKPPPNISQYDIDIIHHNSTYRLDQKWSKLYNMNCQHLPRSSLQNASVWSCDWFPLEHIPRNLFLQNGFWSSNDRCIDSWMSIHLSKDTSLQNESLIAEGTYVDIIAHLGFLQTLMPNTNFLLQIYLKNSFIADPSPPIL